MSESAYPGASVLRSDAVVAAGPIVPAAETGDERAVRTWSYLDVLVRQPLVREMLEHRLPFEWSDVKWLATIYPKDLAQRPSVAFCGPGSDGSSGRRSKELQLVSAYFMVFVGSFNFDPRSSRLNTDMGFVIDCPGIAARIADAVSGPLAERAYLVRLTADDRLQWVERIDGAEVVHDAEPRAGCWRQLGVSVLSLLPIEWLL